MLQCEICQRIWQLLAVPDTETTPIDLGSFNEALASPCPDHTQVLKEFQSYCSRGDESNSRGVSSDMGFTKGPSAHSMTLLKSVKNLGFFWNLATVKKEGAENHPGIGRILDRDWIDTNAAVEWKEKCLSSHGSQCENPLKIPPATPAWLIDVKKKCLVAGGDSRPYVALSYRSSEDASHRATMAELQKEGSLDRPENSAQIPLKIRHAISLTDAMGERYLWADFLCFDHSDPSTTFRQLSLMTSIYASALFTIIAADGTRTEGIKGLKDVSLPRTLNQKVFPMGEEHLIVRNMHSFSLEHWHEYHKRGWTYQEFKMSPRKLIFMKGQVHWQCSCSVCHEELAAESGVDQYIDPRPKVLASGYPDLGSLSTLLAYYNERELTYDDDALAAITGLLTVFSRSFPGGFLYGLPEMMLDRALAWQPQWSSTNLRKREPTADPSYLRSTATDLPTWSWVTWQGLFSFRYGEAARVNDRQYYVQETSPITQWYTSSAPSGQPRRRIRSTWFEDRDRRKDVNQPLPDGWSRVPAPTTGPFREEPMLYPDGCGQYLYQHRAFPDPDCDKWYYPFDVPNIDTSTPFSIPEQTRYLFCKTWKTSFWSRRERNAHEGAENHMLTLHKDNDIHEAEIGRLHLQTDEQRAMWPEPSTDRDDTNTGEISMGKSIELVAINYRVHHAKTFNEEKRRYEYPLKREERVTVLWVKWEGGVAYRLACGYVDRAAWESLALETVDLILG